MLTNAVKSVKWHYNTFTRTYSRWWPQFVHQTKSTNFFV